MSSNSLSENELAWLAGLFDGEGSVGFYRRVARNRTGCSYYIVASIAMTHAPTITRVASMFGGTEFIKQYKKAEHRNCFYWRASGALARDFLREILPYSLTKAEEIRVALAADEIRMRKVGPMRRGRHNSLTESDMAELDTHVSRLKLLKRVEHI